MTSLTSKHILWCTAELHFPPIQGRQGEQDLSEARSRISLLESDLQAAEQEKDNLIRKVQLLQRAMDSPDSRLKLKRMLERSVCQWC